MCFPTFNLTNLQKNLQKLTDELTEKIYFSISK